MQEVVDGGDHSMLIGRVPDCVTPVDREAPVYVDRGFARPDGSAPEVARAH